jgi:hypothetical protein
MWVAWGEPERLVAQRPHRRQEALGREVEIVSEPALRHEEERTNSSAVATWPASLKTIAGTT